MSECMYTMDEIASLVAEYFRKSVDEMKGKSHLQETVYPRHVAMYLFKKYTLNSPKTIAKFFNRDRTVALYGINKINRILDNGQDLPDFRLVRRGIEHIEGILNNGHNEKAQGGMDGGKECEI